MKTEVIAFRQDIPANTSLTITEMLKDKGEIVEVRVRFYSGQERALQIRPYIQLFNKMSEDLFTWGGTNNKGNFQSGNTDHFLSGDDDYFVFPVSATVEMEDNVAVWVNNTDPVYTYTLVCDVVVQYYA